MQTNGGNIYCPRFCLINRNNGLQLSLRKEQIGVSSVIKNEALINR